MSGRISSFFFSNPQEQNRLKYSPVAKILLRILIRQTLKRGAAQTWGRSNVGPGLAITLLHTFCDVLNYISCRIIHVSSLGSVGCAAFSRFAPVSIGNA